MPLPQYLLSQFNEWIFILPSIYSFDGWILLFLKTWNIFVHFSVQLYPAGFIKIFFWGGGVDFRSWKWMTIERAFDVFMLEDHPKWVIRLSEFKIRVQNLIPLQVICLAEKPESEWGAESPWRSHTLKIPNREYKLIKSLWKKKTWSPPIFKKICHVI